MLAAFLIGGLEEIIFLIVLIFTIINGEAISVQGIILMIVAFSTSVWVFKEIKKLKHR